MKPKSTLLGAFAVLLLFANSPVFAQVLDNHNHSKDHVCVLPAAETSEALISTPYTRMTKEVAAPRVATFVVNYLPNGTTHNGYNCLTWPAAAQTAFTYAANIWGNTIESGQTIYIDACWSDGLGASTLGAAGASGYHTLTGGGIQPNTFYPKALTEAILEAHINN